MLSQNSTITALKKVLKMPLPVIKLWLQNIELKNIKPTICLSSTLTYLTESISTVFLQGEMAGVDMKPFLRVMKENLQPLDVEKLKYILADSLVLT